MIEFRSAIGRYLQQHCNDDSAQVDNALIDKRQIHQTQVKTRFKKARLINNHPKNKAL